MTVYNLEHDRNAVVPIDVTVPLMLAESNDVQEEKALDGMSLTPDVITTWAVTLLYVSIVVNSLELETVSVPVVESNVWKEWVINKTIKNGINSLWCFTLRRMSEKNEYVLKMIILLKNKTCEKTNKIIIINININININIENVILFVDEEIFELFCEKLKKERKKFGEIEKYSECECK